jgi:hypothetical protein
MQVLTYIYVFTVWFVGSILLRVVNRFEPNPLLAAVPVPHPRCRRCGNRKSVYALAPAIDMARSIFYKTFKGVMRGRTRATFARSTSSSELSCGLDDALFAQLS